MRFVRRASLMFSLTLIVAISVGYFLRSSELNNARDLEVRAAAEIGSNDLSAVIRTIEIAATTGIDAELVAASIADHHPSIGVCVVPAAGRAACAGSGRRPEPDTVATLVDVDADADADATDTGAAVGMVSPEVTLYDHELTIVVRGGELVAVARLDADLAQRGDVRIFASNRPPSAEALSGFVTDGTVRQTATVVPGTSGLYVVASAPEDASALLPVEEQRFYLIVFALSVVLMLLAGVTIVVEHRSLIERASIDPLTRLPNRGEFERRGRDTLVDVARRDESCCLMLFDLNGFKQINDTYGHNAGDEMLKVVAHRLEKAVRDDEDVIARWGGDEFVVLLRDVETDEMCQRRARQLADQVGGRTRLEGIDEPLRAKVSVGVALWPEHGHDIETLVDAADKAMYEAKRQGAVACVARAPSDSTLVSIV